MDQMPRNRLWGHVGILPLPERTDGRCVRGVPTGTSARIASQSFLCAAFGTRGSGSDVQSLIVFLSERR
jgi:hypothetical protein